MQRRISSLAINLHHHRSVNFEQFSEFSHYMQRRPKLNAVQSMK